ncbi:hypothetical protein FB446DRAFT_708347 [Lentinula raphanica]|nr:hypothetical protein FB446DRAFT_708347 [Lentinula raphanica]
MALFFDNSRYQPFPVHHLYPSVTSLPPPTRSSRSRVSGCMRSLISKEDKSNSRGREMVQRRVYLNTPSYQLGTEASNSTPDRGGFNMGMDKRTRVAIRVRARTKWFRESEYEACGVFTVFESEFELELEVSLVSVFFFNILLQYSSSNTPHTPLEFKPFKLETPSKSEKLEDLTNPREAGLRELGMYEAALARRRDVLETGLRGVRSSGSAWAPSTAARCLCPGLGIGEVFVMVGVGVEFLESSSSLHVFLRLELELVDLRTRLEHPVSLFQQNFISTAKGVGILASSMRRDTVILTLVSTL